MTSLLAAASGWMDETSCVLDACPLSLSDLIGLTWCCSSARALWYVIFVTSTTSVSVATEWGWLAGCTVLLRCSAIQTLGAAVNAWGPGQGNIQRLCRGLMHAAAVPSLYLCF